MFFLINKNISKKIIRIIFLDGFYKLPSYIEYRICLKQIEIYRTNERNATMKDNTTFERTRQKKSLQSRKITRKHPLWALTDSNRRPSACKADALNQLS